MWCGLLACVKQARSLFHQCIYWAIILLAVPKGWWESGKLVRISIFLATNNIVENYEQLMNRFAQLEDSILAQKAQIAAANSQMVGSEIFTAELERLAALDN